MENAPHILVVDDHREIRELLAQYLQKNGLRVSVADGGPAMRQVLEASDPVDLIVLDIMMPGEDGLSLFRALRQERQDDIPILFLTAVAEEADRIVGFELGADAYVTKPFNPRELLARVRGLLRRAAPPVLPAGEGEPRQYRFEGWTLDLSRYVLLDTGGEKVALGSAEFNLLAALVSRPGVILSRQQLLDITAGRNAQVFDRSIDNLISRLRRRIEPDQQQPTFIKTVRGGGYVFAARVEEVV